MVFGDDDELVVDEVDEVDGVFLFGNKGLPIFAVGVIKVDGDQASVGGIEVGVDIEGGAGYYR